MSNTKLKAPYVYPGGKSTVADLVWSRFGNPDVYAEPFMGSGAVLLRRPLEHFDPKYGARLENVTDLNFYIPNFWRSVQRSPEEVARWCDYPVSEIDLHARHRYLTRGPDAERFKAAMLADADYHDPRFAGWWCWGMNLWIGGAWCHDAFVERKSFPDFHQGRGVDAAPLSAQPGADHKKRPHLGESGVGTCGIAKPIADWEQVPNIDSTARGGCGTNSGPRPQLADAYDIGRARPRTSGPGGATPAAHGLRTGCSGYPIGSAGRGSCTGTGSGLLAATRR